MNFDLGAVFGQIVSVYARLPFAQKIAIPFLFFGSILIIVFVARWAARPDYGLLYSDLEQSDAASITEKLKDQRIDYRLRHDGRTIEISPRGLVHQVRLDLASGGLPRGGSTGFELFNETSLGRTGFVEKVMLVRALQGELERTISSIDAIKSVRVHITNPEKSVFVKRDVLPTASVLLRLKPGMELTQQQTKGIAYLVANSVERLEPKNVTILDSNGNILNLQQEGIELAGVDTTRMKFQKTLEAEYSQRIETMLAEILGPGKVVARVTADLDFSKYEREEESYDPGGQVVRSERSTVESGGLSAEGGVPGVVSNLTNDPGILTPPDSSRSANTRSESIKNFEVSRAVSRTISSPGAIQKLSVAVLVDGQYASTPTGETGPDGAAIAIKEYQPLSTDMLRRIENLVKQAVGYDASRGDIISVENIRFLDTEDSLSELLTSAASQEIMLTWVKFGSIILLGIIFMFVVLYPLVKFLVSPTEAEVDLSRLLPSGIEDLEAELQAERTKMVSRPEQHLPEVDIEELEELLSENSKIVKDNPQQAALLIRYWLNDGKM
jgi:flagellar M-ring protein FliF